MKGRDFVIQFVSLSAGEHKYEYEINDTFFEGLDYSEIKQGQIHVDLNLLKQSSMMAFQFSISGTVKVICDLCAEEFDLPIEGNYKLIIKVGGNDSTDEDDDIVTIAANEHEFDISQYLFEYITLSLPIKRVHPMDKKGKPTCDKEMLKKVSKYLITENEKEQADPRWEGLKNIKLN